MILVAIIPFLLLLLLCLRYIIAKNLGESAKYKILFIIAMFLLIAEIALKSYDIYHHRYNNLWFGDLCHGVILLSIIGVIFKWNTLLRIVSTWSIIGSIITFASGGIAFNKDTYSWFLQTGIIHMILFVFAILTIVFYYKKYKTTDLYYSFIFSIAYALIYVLPVGTILGHYFGETFQMNSTGLFRASIYPVGSEYHVFTYLHMPYPIPTLLFYVLGNCLNLFFGIEIVKSPKYKFIQILLIKRNKQTNI